MSFAEFASSQGLLPKYIRADGKIHRCGTVNNPRSTNGAYMFDGLRGWCMRWGATDPVWWNDPNAKPWTEQDKKAWHRNRLEDAVRIRQKHLKAARDAEKIISECAFGTHPYMIKKGLPETTVLIDSEGFMYVPMRDYVSNKLNGLQAIKWDSEAEEFKKKFTPGMKAKGAIYRIGTGKETILVEGYVTGLSVYQAVKRMNLNMAVVCCFSASNIVHVAKEIGHFVMADNDESKTGEKSAIQTGLPWTMPETINTDWNDVHIASGVMPICKAIIEVKKSLYKRNEYM